MKKFALCLFLIGIIVAAAAIGVGILVKDNEEVQAISAVTGVPVMPERGEELRLKAETNGLRLSGVVSFLLRIYPYITMVTTIAAAVAAFGLLLLLLVLIIKPVLSILLLIAIAAVIYFGSQGVLGPEVGDFVNMVISNVKGFVNQLVGFVNETKIMDTFNQLVNH